MMSLRTPICELLGIEYPVVLAGMGGASTPKLAAAVSNAGGLGILGAAGCSPRRLRKWVQEMRSLTDKPFGVDTLLPASVRREAYKSGGGPSPMEKLPECQQFAKEFMDREGLVMPDRETLLREAGIEPIDTEGPPIFTKEFFEAQMEVVIEEKVAVYAAGLGNPGPWADRLHANGTKVIAVVGTVRHARQVAQSGIDIIVAQGHDGGGHNAPIGTMALIPQVVDVVGDIPVLGAGGIADGRGIAAALMLGAQGVWIGTAFLATNESGLRDFQKQVIVDAIDESTMVSRSVTGKPARVLRGKWPTAWEGAPVQPLPMPFQSMVAMPVLAAATAAKRSDISPGFAGQALGLIHAVRPAADVFQDLVTDAERVLARAAGLSAAEAPQRGLHAHA
jgi:nitronate monooxygenase